MSATSMNSVSVPPIGRSLNAGYSATAGSGAFRKIWTGPEPTDANTYGDASGTVICLDSPRTSV